MTFKGFAASLYSFAAGIDLFGIRTGEYFNPAIVVPPQGNRRRATQAGLFPLRSSWSFHPSELKWRARGSGGRNLAQNDHRTSPVGLERDDASHCPATKSAMAD